MKLLGMNNELISRLSGKYTLLTSSISEFQIYKNDNFFVCIDVRIKLLYIQGKTLLLTFEGVKEYSLNYHDNYSFYNIETYKFFSTESGIYISFDPNVENLEEYQSMNKVSEYDNDYILSEKVAGWVEE